MRRSVAISALLHIVLFASLFVEWRSLKLRKEEEVVSIEVRETTKAHLKTGRKRAAGHKRFEDLTLADLLPPSVKPYKEWKTSEQLAAEEASQGTQDAEYRGV